MAQKKTAKTPSTVNSVQNASTAAVAFDRLKWLFVIALVAFSALGNNYFLQDSLLFRILAFGAVFVAAIALFFTTFTGKKVWQLFQESRVELARVVWPTRQETTQTTLMVIVVTAIMVLVLWAFDSILALVISWLFL